MKITDSEDVKENTKASDEYRAAKCCPCRGYGCFHIDEVVIVAKKIIN